MSESEISLTACKGEHLDIYEVSAIGIALVSSGLGEKAGIATDGKATSKAVAYMIMGAMSAAGMRVWDFSESFYAQFRYLVKFCSLDCGVFIGTRNSEIGIRVCGKYGLPISFEKQNEIESHIKNRKFVYSPITDCKEISQMQGVSMMYRRELLNCSVPVPELSCFIKCKNEKVTDVLEECLYRIECKQGDEMTFKINGDGTSLSVFHRDCGWLSNDIISAILIANEAKCGCDIAVPVNSPFVFEELAKKYGVEFFRYSSAEDLTGLSMLKAAENCRFSEDALFAAIKLLKVVYQSEKSVAQLSKELPKFYVSRKIFKSEISKTEFENKCEKNGIAVGNSTAVLEYPEGKVLVTPSRNFKMLRILSQAENYEMSKELCASAQKYLEAFLNR